MQLQLYDKRTTDFTMNGNPINNAYDAHVIRDEGFMLKFKLAVDENKNHLKIQHEMIIGAMTPDGMNYFRVFDVTPKTDHVEVIALHLFYYLDHRKVKHFALTNVNGKMVIEAFKANLTGNIAPYTFDSSVLETHDFSVETQGEPKDFYNALEIINRIATRWDSEFLLNGFDVRMVKRLGKRTKALLYEHKNISDFENETTIRNLITRIHATAKWRLDHDDPQYVKDTKDESVNERKISITVDSPLINEYSQVYEENYENNDCRTIKELTDWVNLKYSTDHVDKPKRTIEVETNIVDGTTINYGDELVLKYLIHGIDETIRCVGYDYDPQSEEHYSITLGDWRDSFGKSMNRAVADVSERQKSEFERLNKKVQIVHMAANGVNRFTSGENPVPNPINGDIWFYFTPDRPNEVEQRIYDEKLGLWVKKDITNEQVQKQFDEINKKASDLTQSIRIAQETADQANDRWEEAKETIKLLDDESKFTLAILGEGDGFQYPDNKLQIVGQDPVVDTSKMFKVTPEKGYETLKLAGKVEDVTAPVRFDVSKFVFVERPYSQVVIEVTES